MRFLPRLLSFLLLFSIAWQSKARQDSTGLQAVLNKLKKLNEEQPIEKVYLHFDKPYYAVADTIWFKAYVTNAKNEPSPFSKIVYVDMLNEKDSLVQSLRLPIKNGVVGGNIPLNPQNYKQGNYYARAYTTWMLNFDPYYYFTKNITLGQAFDKQLITNIFFTDQTIDKNVKSTIRIQFKSLSKKPYANKPVNWQVYSNYDLFARGRGATDAYGFITITVSSKNGELIKNGIIVTDLAIDEKETASKSFNLKQNYSNIDFKFFPEGGEMISRIPNQIGFKAIKADGLGIDAKGVVIDEQGTEISVFWSSNAGMGSFYLTPASGKSYKAKLTFTDGTVKIYDLPKAIESGITIQTVNAADGNIDLKILANEAYLNANKGKTLFIICQNNNIVYYAAKFNLNAQSVPVKIDKNKFPSGVVQFTLLDEKTFPLAERLAFIYHAKAISLTIKSDLPAYKPRQKVKLSIDAKNHTGPVVGDFSLAVIDENKAPSDENTETTILSALLLTSDLKGFIEKPNYYFIKTDDKKLADLDKLMLTQGYRRFSYQDLAENKFPQIQVLPEQGIGYWGTLRDLTGMPIKKGSVRLIVKDKPISAAATTTNMGLFNFQNLNFPDSSQIIITAKYNPNPNNLMLMLDGMPTAGKGFNPNSYAQATNIDTALSAYLNNSAKQYRYLRTLKEVVIKGTPAKRVTHADYPALSGLGNIPQHQIDGSAFSDCISFLDCLRARATGLTYDINEHKFYITRNYNQGNKTPVQVFLSGMAVDANQLNTVNAAEVDNVEIFTQDQLGLINTTYGANGVLVVNLKKKPVGQKISKQQLLDMIPKKNELTFFAQGYAKEREFYSPKYLPNAPLIGNDLRTTIYWNPKVITDEKGVAHVEFFNADGKGVCKVVIEGFDKDGNLARTVYRYQVK